MPLRIMKSDHEAGLRLVGELDVSNVADLAEAIRAEVDRGGDVVLELGGLAFMDSSGIQLLIRTSRELEGRGQLTLVSPGELVRRTLELVPVERLGNVEIIDDEHA